MEKKKKRIGWIILGIFVLALIIFRIMLPSIVTNYVNKVLADLEGYRGSIEDVDIALIRGAYKINGLEIIKVDGNEEVPFVEIDVIDLSVEWKAIFDGAVVGEIIFEQPTINFIGGGEEEAEVQSGEDVDWTETVKELMPLTINRLEVINGKVTFNDFSTEPQVDLVLDNLQAIALNLSNVVNENDPLPSDVQLRAKTFGGGDLRINMGMNALKEIPDLDLNMEFENVDMTALNEFLMAYAGIDVEKGNFNLYSEIIVDNKAITGYVRPIVEDLKVLDANKEVEDPLNFAWQAVVGAFMQVFSNQPTDRFATEVPLEGSLENVDAGVWPSVWNIFKNTFIEALQKSTSGELEFRNQQEENKEEEEKKGFLNKIF